MTVRKRKLHPIPLAIAMLWVAGVTREDRSQVLRHAAGCGDLHCCIGCIVSGCDLEATGECGHTTALLAAWRGRVAVLQVLGWAGAELHTACSHSGVSLLAAAFAPCRNKSRQAVADCLAVLGVSLDLRPSPLVMLPGPLVPHQGTTELEPGLQGLLG